MRCEARADAIADAAAGGAPTAELEAHLAACPVCAARRRRMVDALAAVDTALAGVRTAEPSAALEGHIRDAVARRGAPRTPAIRWLPAALAAGVVLALAGWLATRTAPPTAAPPESPRVAEVHVPRSIPSAPPSPPAPRPPVTVRVARRLGPPAALPEVVVDPREAAALRDYVEGLERRRLGRDALIVVADTAPLPETKPLGLLSLDTPALDSALPPGF